MKIYTKKLDKLKKKKIILKRTGSFITALVIFSNLTACTLKKNTTQSDISSTNTNYNIELDESNNKEKKSLDNLIKELDLITPHYNNESYYLNDDEIDKLISFTTTKYTHANLNITDVISNIVKNSREIDEYESFFSDQYSWKALISSFVNIENNATNDFPEDLCVLKNIAILKGSISDNKTDSIILAKSNFSKKHIIMDTDKIREIAIQNNFDYKSFLEYHLRHEINHFRQFSCDCRKSLGQNYELLKFQNRTSGVSTLIESSATSEIYLNDALLKNFKTIDKNYTISNYESEREDESILLLLTLFNENTTINDYYNAIFDTDLNGLFKAFNLNSYNDKKELFKIIYAIDARNNRNDYLLQAVVDEKIENPLDINNYKNFIGYAYRSSIFKIVTKRLALYTYKNNLSLERNIAIFSLIRNIISHDITDVYNYNDYQSITDICNISDCYINFISNYYEKDENDIKSLINNIGVHLIKEFSEDNSLPNSYQTSSYIDDFLSTKELSYYILTKHPALVPEIYITSSFNNNFQNLEEINNLNKEKIKIKKDQTFK